MNSVVLFVILCSKGMYGTCDVVYADMYTSEHECSQALQHEVRANKNPDVSISGVCLVDNLAEYCELTDPMVESDDMYAACDNYYHGMEP
jgi:hypothetical protein